MKRWPIIFGLALVLALAGCDRPLRQAPQLGETIEAEAVPETAPPLPEVAHDKFGNLYKAFPCSAGAMLLAAPEADGSLLRHLRFGDPLFVFRIGQDGWLYLGSDPRGKGEGYCRQSDCFLTTHHEMLRLRGETRAVRRPAELFADLDELVARLQSGDSDAIMPDWREAELAIGSRELPPCPVLKVKDIPLTSGRVIRAVQIGGWTWSNLPQGNVQPAPVRLATWEKKVNRFDLLLVVDATGSMEVVWDALQRYLREVIGDLRRETELDVRVGVLAYRDHEDSRWLMKRHPLTGDLDKLVEWLRTIEAGAGGDFEEAMFDACMAAVAKTQWRDGSYRVAVLAANNASHPENDPQNPRELTLAEVCRAAQANDVCFYTLQLPYHPAFHGDRQRLPQQLRGIASKTGGVYLKIDDAQHARSTQLIGYFRDAFAQGGFAATTERHLLRELAKGRELEEIRQELGLPHTVFVRVYRHLERRLGIDPTKLRVGEHGYAGFEAGWTVQDPQTWELCVLMREEEYRLLVRVCDMIVRRGAEQRKNLHKLFVEALKAVLGENVDPDQWSLDAAMKAQGIPLRPDTLLAYDPIEFEILPHASRVRMAEQLRRRLAALVAAAERPEARVWKGFVVVPAHCLP